MKANYFLKLDDFEDNEFFRSAMYKDVGNK